MVAGMFAFSPVEQASTVHTSGTVTTAGGTVLDSAADLTDREVAGDGDEIAITIGTDDDTPFIIHQIIACGDAADDNDAELFVNSIIIDGDDIRQANGDVLNIASINGDDDVLGCANPISKINDENDNVLRTSIASDGGDIVITLEGAIAGDTLTSVKVVATVQSGANIVVVSSLGVGI